MRRIVRTLAFALWICGTSPGLAVASQVGEGATPGDCPVAAFMPPRPAVFQLAPETSTIKAVVTAQTLIDQIVAIEPPKRSQTPEQERKEGRRFVLETDRIAKRLHTALRRAMRTREGRAAIEDYAYQIVQRWKSKEYPPGLSREIWDPVKDQCTSVPAFLAALPRHTASGSDLHADMLRNIMTTSVWARALAQVAPTEAHVTEYRQQLVEAMILHVAISEEFTSPPPDRTEAKLLFPGR